MSWLSENYEKAAIGGAAVIALAFGAVIFKNKGAMSNAFDLEPVKENKDTSVPGLKGIERAKASLGLSHEIHPLDDGGRRLDLFTGIPLFARKGELDKPIDLLKSGQVHEGIDNEWWLKFKLDPGFANSPDLDPDEDGFSNREEYNDKTDPTEFGSHPDPIAKLKVMDVKTTLVYVKPSDFGGKQAMFKIQDARRRDRNRMDGTKPPIKPGDNIEFTGELMKKRFQYLDQFQKDDENGFPKQFWRLRDLQPNKMGKEYTLNQRGEPGIIDSTVEFKLNALKQGGSPFKIPENTRFSLPFDEKAEKKPYLLKKVDLEKSEVEVEYTDKAGQKRSKILPFKRK